MQKYILGTLIAALAALSWPAYAGPPVNSGSGSYHISFHWQGKSFNRICMVGSLCKTDLYQTLKVFSDSRTTRGLSAYFTGSTLHFYRILTQPPSTSGSGALETCTKEVKLDYGTQQKICGVRVEIGGLNDTH
jgi:hypothetical protein